MNNSEDLFEKIASELIEQGYSVTQGALSDSLTKALVDDAQESRAALFKAAGVGRGNEHIKNENIRSDEILWIDGHTDSERDWLAFMQELQQYVNRRLFLGLFSFESHFAHYAPGAFYEKHRDAFRGQSNRILTVVAYLNQEWRAEWGGELLVYNDDSKVLERVLPEGGSLVVFLSEEFPHEVLPATVDRYSIAGWFRLNNTDSTRIDPPQ